MTADFRLGCLLWFIGRRHRKLVIGSLSTLLLALGAAGPSNAQQSFLVSEPPARFTVPRGDVAPWDLVFLGTDESTGAISGVIVEGEHIVLRDLSGGRRVESYPMAGAIVRTYMSDSGRFAAVLLRGDVKKAGDYEQSQSGLALTLIEVGSGLRYTVNLVHGPDDPLPAVSIDDGDGSAIVVHHATGRAVFLTPEGSERLVVRLTEGRHDIERAVLLSRARASGHVAVAVNEPVLDGVRSVVAHRIEVFDAAGRTTGGFEIPPRTLSNLEISEDGSIVGVGAYDVPDNVFTTTFYDVAGRQLYQADFAAEVIVLDRSNSRAMISNKRRAALVDLSAGRTAMSYRENAGETLLATALSQDGRLAALVSGLSRFEGGRFFSTGNRITEWVTGQDGNMVARSIPIAEVAERVKVEIGAFGLAVGLDDQVLVFQRR